jgi:hypothetical protein
MPGAKTVITALLILICTVSAIAEDLDIDVDGPKCHDVTKVWVVMDGAEQTAFAATLDPPKSCHWKVLGLPSFNAKWTSFSLRFNNSRTGCKYAKPPATGHASATLRFQYGGVRTHDVEITTVPPLIALAYTRSMPKDVGDPESGPCVENTYYGTSPVTVLSVWYPDEALRSPAKNTISVAGAKVVETVRIKFGDTDLIKRPPLMILNDVSVARFINPKDNTLTADGILAAVIEQLGRSKLGTPPEIVPNLDDYGLKHFEKIGLDRIKVTVAK